ncbi:DUF2721 domain-containing protein [Erythrobacter crassostreae]|uniref:DUF2721 domain-containing protein n=1 Tax=Erythrobacter crassostreae TaxID=2828328 RepID=A0A9X1F2L9_9SPHN|nr:DUF2721 domain-containing protein [Erythrobacter crassostrea]MBV7259171.1 DUF2721 domain-containing protein [Erythrobacter crassostrea]
MFDLFAASDIAAEILERTSSTPDTLSAVQLSLAPAFLLVGIGSIMNVMVTRLNWIAGRIERLSEISEQKQTEKTDLEIDWLCSRRLLARRAIMLATAAAVVISVVIAVLFSSVYIDAKIGTVVAVLWIVTMGLLITALYHFLRETWVAARGPEHTQRKGK